MSLKRIHLSLEPELLAKIDQGAKEELVKRSEFIRSAVIERLKSNEEYNAKLSRVITAGDVPSQKEMLELLKFKDNLLRIAEGRQRWRQRIRAERRKR